MSFPPYPSYQDSGIEWLGALPRHWRVERLGNLYREVSEAGSPELPVLSVSIHTGVSHEEAAPEDSERKIVRSEDRSKYKRVSPNDLTYNMMRAWQGGFGTVQVEGMVSPAYVVARPRTSVPSKYIELLLRTPGAVEEMRRRSRGVTDFRLRLYWDQFKDIRVALPPQEERNAILAFLDRETAKIDALVEEQRRLIELLKEKRQAVISHAVTKGLDPTVPMKESGVEWLGDVPAHWKVAPLKCAIQSIEQGWSPQCEGFRVEEPEEWGVLKVGCVNGGMFRPEENKALPPELNPMPELGLQQGDILVSRANTRELVGSAALVPKDYSQLMLCDKLYRLRANEAVALPEFLALYLQSRIAREAFELAATGTSASMVNIGQGTVMNLTMALPSASEQQAIVDLVHGMQQRADNLVGASEIAISILEERRAALISAAVTGKIDVRSTAPQQARAA